MQRSRRGGQRYLYHIDTVFKQDSRIKQYVRGQPLFGMAGAVMPRDFMTLNVNITAAIVEQLYE